MSSQEKLTGPHAPIDLDAVTFLGSDGASNGDPISQPELDQGNSNNQLAPTDVGPVIVLGSGSAFTRDPITTTPIVDSDNLSEDPTLTFAHLHPAQILVLP